MPLQKTAINLERGHDRVVNFTEFQACLGDRIIFFSDGVSQAGMGEFRTPLGWGVDSVVDYARRMIVQNPAIAAGPLARRVVEKANRVDGAGPKDDTTCGVIFYRLPRRLLVLSGPPYSAQRDHELLRRFQEFDGRKVIAGGTTANIIGKLLCREIKVDLARLDPEIPPVSRMEGAELVTEGTLTLGKTASALEQKVSPSQLRPNAVRQLLTLLLDSDVIHFVVGTRINPAHQDPNIPVELDLRRNVIRRIARILEEDHLKQTSIEYL